MDNEEIERWEYVPRKGGSTYVCFKNERGEIFHFKKNVLMRGLPCGPFNSAEEVRRPMNILTLANAAALCSMTERNLRYAIYNGKLAGVLRTWWYGHRRRQGWLVDIKDVKELIAKRALSKALGKVEWDISAGDVLGEGKANEL